MFIQIPVMMFWAIWKSRNGKVWENVNPSVGAAVTRARDGLSDWEVVSGKQRAY